MTAISTLYGDRAVVTLLPPLSTAGSIIRSDDMDEALAKHLLSGGLTANVYTELVSLTGSGWLRRCGVYSVDGTSRTVGLKITLDGNDIIDGVSGAIVTVSQGWFAVGESGPNASDTEKWPFYSSLSISVKSSLTETDKVALAYSTGV